MISKKEKKKEKKFSELNLLKPNFNKIVKVRMESLLLGSSQPARFEPMRFIIKKKKERV
jgi:hypothetical protein